MVSKMLSSTGKNGMLSASVVGGYGRSDDFLDAVSRNSASSSMSRPPCNTGPRGVLDSSTHRTSLNRSSHNSNKIYFPPSQNRGHDSWCSPSSARRSWRPKSCPTGDKARVKGRLASVSKPPLFIMSDDLDDSAGSELKPKPQRSSFSVPASPRTQELIRTLDKDCENLPPAFQILCGKNKKKTSRIPASPRPPRSIPPPSNVGQKLRVAVTNPRKLAIQWPPKMPTSSAVKRTPLDMPSSFSRNASVRIHWMGTQNLKEIVPHDSLSCCSAAWGLRGYMRPDVWATPLKNSGKTQKAWRVKRVWSVDRMNEQESELEVLKEHLMDKVKELLGVATGDPNDYDPSSSQWKFDRIYDINGQVQGGTKSQTGDELGMLKEMDAVSDLAAQWSYNEGGDMNCDEDPMWEAFEILPAEVLPLAMDEVQVRIHEKQPSLENVSQTENRGPQSIADKWSILSSSCDNASVCYDWEAQEVKERTSPSKSSRTPNTKTPKVKRAAHDDGPQSIFDLLSPPPVYFWGMDEAGLRKKGLAMDNMS